MRKAIFILLVNLVHMKILQLNKNLLKDACMVKRCRSYLYCITGSLMSCETVQDHTVFKYSKSVRTQNLCTPYYDLSRMLQT